MVEEKFFEEEGGQFQDIEGMQPLPNVPYPFPLPLPRASGLYEWKRQRITYPRSGPKAAPTGQAGTVEHGVVSQGVPQAGSIEETFEPAAIFPWWFSREELRLDVDGRYPLMTASGTVIRDFRSRVEWVAQLAPNGNNHWKGSIWYKDGDENSFPYTNIDIRVSRSWFSNQRAAMVTFSGGGVPDKVLRYGYKSPYFRKVEFEYDTTSDAKSTTFIHTAHHPNRPATLPSETLTVETVFRRAGFNVSRSMDPDKIPSSLAGPNDTWSDMEMHDAMQTYWSRFAGRSQWAMWVFFARLHDMGKSLGGIMFDDIGPQHRQGTAIFTDSFISMPPAGDAAPAAWAQRMRFWTAVHEMGHAFNLAHSWQKALGTSWVPLANEPEARSFMNYPFRVKGGQSEFFADFEYRFSDSELLFMRHAPERFVQMGNADWFDHHGFQNANISAEPNYQLNIRVNRQTPRFEFLEPIMLEMKLTNISGQAQLMDENVLSMSGDLTLIIKKDGKPARQFLPYAQYCARSSNQALNSGQSIYESFLISVGRNGWDMAEPGNYTVQVALHFEDQDIVSNLLRVKISPPQTREEEYLAQDFFSDEVGRILSFNGSHFLASGNDTLRELVDRFAGRRGAIHAQVALANAFSREYKVFDVPAGECGPMSSAAEAEVKLKTVAPDVKQSKNYFQKALLEHPEHAAETLSHILFHKMSDVLAEWLLARGDAPEAEHALDVLYNTLAQRKVLPRVLDTISRRHEQIAKKAHVA